MSRHFRITFLIGTVAALLFVGAVSLDIFRFWDQAMWEFLGFKGIVPAGSVGVQIALILLMAYGLAWTTADVLKAPLKILIALVAMSELFTAAWLLAFHEIFFSPFAAALAGAIAFILALIFSKSPQGERRRLVAELFGSRISKTGSAALCNSNDDLGLDGADRVGTVVVAEILNQDELQATLPTGEYLACNNRFLSIAGDIFRDRGGYIDECDGGCLRAVFNVPVPDAAHALTACRAALAVREALKAMQLETELRWEILPDVRVGLDSGPLIAGVYGVSQCGRFSVCGETVEFARRLTVGNLAYGSFIMMGASTYQEVSEVLLARPLELLRRKDEMLPREVYELLGEQSAFSPAEIERRDRFWDAVVLFREQKFEKALQLFEQCQTKDQKDPVVQFYIQQIQEKTHPELSARWQSSRILTGF